VHCRDSSASASTTRPRFRRPSMRRRAQKNARSDETVDRTRSSSPAPGASTDPIVDINHSGVTCGAQRPALRDDAVERRIARARLALELEPSRHRGALFF